MQKFFRQHWNAEGLLERSGIFASNGFFYTEPNPHRHFKKGHKKYSFHCHFKKGHKKYGFHYGEAKEAEDLGYHQEQNELTKSIVAMK
jgi:hypothetical protein